MNTTSLLLALFVLLLFAGTTWAIYRYSEDYWSDRRRRLTCGGLSILTVAFTVFAYYSDSGLRATTLYEVVVNPPESDEYVVVFETESPDVAHDLLVHPLTRPLEEAEEPIELLIVLTTQDGGVLLDTAHTFEVEEDLIVDRSGGVSTKVGKWDSETFHFTPEQRTSCTLKLTLTAGPKPQLHVRIADPTKTDGKRAPGY